MGPINPTYVLWILVALAVLGVVAAIVEAIERMRLSRAINILFGDVAREVGKDDAVANALGEGEKGAVRPS